MKYHHAILHILHIVTCVIIILLQWHKSITGGESLLFIAALWGIFTILHKTNFNQPIVKEK